LILAQKVENHRQPKPNRIDIPGNDGSGHVYPLAGDDVLIVKRAPKVKPEMA
jgi:hypothetical protein